MIKISNDTAFYGMAVFILIFELCQIIANNNLKSQISNFHNHLRNIVELGNIQCYIFYIFLGYFSSISTSMYILHQER